MEWAQVSQQKALDVRMKKINQKVEDGKKLSKNDLFTILIYQQQTHSKELSNSVRKYMEDNENDISSDLTVDSSTTLLEEYGKYLSKNPNLTINGRMFKDYGVGIAKVGKYGGHVMGSLGFGFGLYTDIKEDNKTIGEVVAHNGLLLGAGTLGTFLGSGLLFSNPIGWAIVGGIGLTYLVDQMYKNDIFGLKDGTSWIGKN
ncbi:hypothetical protein [Staphylococcus caledonicus]|uniref:hypothetical protein n=1 Tax=Staphylococcus caledonicus TaxID=2741333 RepID=UPI0018E44AA3|nr:hypothetical protein [Staphylococcus caledonicus]MBI5972868.1 hypothetical protein [Staphylococcus caledonicus]